MGPRLRGGLAALRERIDREIADDTLRIPEPNRGITPAGDSPP